MKRNTFLILISLLAGATLFHIKPILAQTHVIADLAKVAPTGTAVLATVACNAGVSPCTVTNSALTILNADVNRTECLLQNLGTVVLYCLKGAGTVAVGLQHFTLKPDSVGGATPNGDGGSYACNSGPTIYTGAISCKAASAVVTANLNASASRR